MGDGGKPTGTGQQASNVSCLQGKLLLYRPQAIENRAANNAVTETVQHSKWRDFLVEPNVCYRRLVINSGGVQNANTVACSEGAI